MLAYGEWLKVRDVNGDMAWTEARGLNGKRNVITRSANLKIRSTPDDAATAVFTADKGILLEVTETAAGGWLKVRHRDQLLGLAPPLAPDYAADEVGGVTRHSTCDCQTMSRALRTPD